MSCLHRNKSRHNQYIYILSRRENFNYQKLNSIKYWIYTKQNKLPETSEERHALFVFPILYSYARISYRTLVYISGALGFMSGTWFFIPSSQDIPLDCLALLARGPCDLGSQRTLTIGERGLGYLSPQGTVTSSHPFYEREWLTSPGI